MSRFRDVWDAIRGHADRPAQTPVEGELAFADPLRLFGGFAAYNPSILATRKGLSVFDEMRRDDQVKAAMQFKKHAVLSTGWAVVSPPDKPDDWEVSEFVRATIKNLEGTFDETLLAIMSALDYGYSVSEKVFEERDGFIQLKAIKTKRPHAFRFEADEFGNLLPDGIIQGQIGAEVRLPVDKFVLMQHQAEFGNFYGISDLEAAYRPYWSKSNTYRWLGMCLERFGIPPVFALYKPGSMTPRQIDTLKQVLTNIQASTSGAIPRDSKESLEMWSPELAGQVSSVFIPALDRFDRDIARALLMPGLLGLTNDQVGSQARARVIFDVFMFTIEFLRGVLQERVVMEQIIKPLVMLNFAIEEDEVPQFVLNPLTDETREGLLESWARLLQIGAVKATPADEAHIRALLDFPEREVEEDDELLAPVEEDEPEDEDSPESEAENRQRTYAELSRSPNSIEAALQIDFKEIGETLDRRETEATAAAAKVLLAAKDRIKKRLLKMRTPSAAVVNGVAEQIAPKLRRVVLPFVTTTFKDGQQRIRQEVPRLAQHQADFDETEALKWIRTKAGFTVKGITDAMIEEARQVIMQGIKQGKPVSEVVIDLEEALVAFIGPAVVITDVKQLTPPRLKTIFRTNATEAFNQGRLIEMRRPGIEKFLNGVEYSAILDSATTPVCRHLDGRIFKTGSSDLSALTPPNHFNCRSVLVPVTPDISVGEYITPGQIGTAKDLAGKGFT